MYYSLMNAYAFFRNEIPGSENQTVGGPLFVRAFKKVEWSNRRCSFHSNPEHAMGLQGKTIASSWCIE